MAKDTIEADTIETDVADDRSARFMVVPEGLIVTPPLAGDTTEADYANVKWPI